ncbi:hypothetical protein GCM10017674_46490 [Streptomyces gardneri]|uniref:Uncharacterized protein n=1 Tax=Streptomyces gardneri TaxID=66892 RepID=A0A4Y3RP75_9ACTN|nr:hypothetical protein SGA01_41780 [Streptomyces gardneri]GHH06318.1 hypothetical protein GCM10017674_46490 [Streptomyces gardneri]
MWVTAATAVAAMTVYRRLRRQGGVDARVGAGGAGAVVGSGAGRWDGSTIREREEADDSRAESVRTAAASARSASSV